MDGVAAIPVTIDPEAAELVAELGMQAELERMLEHARQTIPGLRRLHVVYELPYDTGPDPSVVIEAYRDPAARQPDDQTWKQYSRWEISTFPPTSSATLRFSSWTIWGMAGRGFLDVARDVVTGPTQFHWRAAVIHAYYALVLECRDVLAGWGFPVPRRENMHTWG